MKNKRKGRQQLKKNSNNQIESDYDVASRFQKIRNHQGRNYRDLTNIEGETSSNGYNSIEKAGTSINSQIHIPNITITTDSGALNHVYDKFDEKMSSITTANEQAHNELRKGYEKKIEESASKFENKLEQISNDIKDRLPIQWYVWTVIAIVAIVSLIYLLSYSKVLDQQENNNTSIQRINEDKAVLNNEIEHIKCNIEVLDKSIQELKQRKR